MRPAAWRFGLGVLLALPVACWTGGQSAAPVAAREPAAPDLSGKYQCSISEQGYDYPPYACEIRHDGARVVLVKLEGTERFEGEIRATAHGFRFAGEYFCAFGDCKKPLHGAFVADGNGGYRGTFSDDAELVVHLWGPMIGELAGGATYGGAMYGGALYGGSVYGGYGSRPSKKRRNIRP